MLRKLLFIVPVVALFAAQAQANPGCCTPVTHCETHYVEQVKYVPTWVTECRTVQCVEQRKEIRERKYTVQKCVPQIEKVEQEYTVLVPVEEVKIEKYLVKVPVCREEDREYTVMVPCQETRVGTRKVCRCVPCVETRTVTKDCGHWQTVCHEVCTPCCQTSCCGCRSCSPATCVSTVCKKVWCPNIVQEQIQVTVNKTECVDEQYEYQVTVCKPEKRIQKVKIQDCVTEERQREVKCVKHCPEKRVRTIDVVKNITVTEEKCEQIEVCVPVTVEKQIEVKVCKMVEQRCVVPVQKCCTKVVCHDPCRRCCY